jgi:hypothetical protein
MTGWIIGVLVELPEEPVAVRHFFAVRQDDRARAEWKALDGAALIGHVATSPVGGMEPVHAVSRLTLRSVNNLALKPGEARNLGRRWPRRWITPEAEPEPSKSTARKA